MIYKKTDALHVLRATALHNLHHIASNETESYFGSQGVDPHSACIDVKLPDAVETVTATEALSRQQDYQQVASQHSINRTFKVLQSHGEQVTTCCVFE